MQTKEKPKVLLLGNGINRAYKNDSWAELLKEISCRDDFNVDDLKSPMPLQAILVTNDDIKSAVNSHKDKFYGKIKNEEYSGIVSEILDMGFDHILTTNYSYELEMVAENSSSISDYKLKKMVANTKPNKRPDAKYLIRTYNECSGKTHKNKIWHIHGEARKKDSMILGHYYYTVLLYKMKEYIDSRKDTYEQKQAKGEDIEINSWLDAFILGDVYVLGFGFGFSEFDLWWLLNRKKRERAKTGTVYFYEPEENELSEKIELLKLMDVKPETCGIKLPVKPAGNLSEEQEKEYEEKKNATYVEFYKSAIKEIKQKISTNKEDIK